MKNKLSLFLGKVYKRYRYEFGDTLGRATTVTIDLTDPSAYQVITNSDYFTVLTSEKLQPSLKDLNISSSTRKTGLGLPRARRAVICKGEFENNKITLFPNPAYRATVNRMAKEFGAIVGDDISYSPQCWESFHNGYPPETGGIPKIPAPAVMVIIAIIIFLISRGWRTQRVSPPWDALFFAKNSLTCYNNRAYETEHSSKLRTNDRYLCLR